MAEVNNAKSVQVQLDHFMDMLRLCRSDNMSIRDLVPGLMIRLNKDQECYDFIKWWSVVGANPHYDWGNPDLPYLDVKNADIFESAGPFCSRFPDLSHLSCMCLLKIKLLFEITRLEQSTASLGPVVPGEILDLIQSSIPQSPAVRASRDIMFGDSNVRKFMMNQLKAQIDALFDAVEAANHYFWSALIDPCIDLTELPQGYSPGSVEEMTLVLRYNYDAWAETPGAIDWIETMVDSSLNPECTCTCTH